jgi:hypothetical protein
MNLDIFVFIQGNLKTAAVQVDFCDDIRILWYNEHIYLVAIKEIQSN